jgi:hypothetical protein
MPDRRRSRRRRARSSRCLDTAPDSPRRYDPPDAADAGIRPRQGPQHSPGPGQGIVIDEDDFERDAGERRSSRRNSVVISRSLKVGR